jgi:hypothetical protein
LPQAASASTAANVTIISFNPSSVVANGSSTTTAVAKVTDSSGNTVPGDNVSFSNQVGKTTDNLDGTYSGTVQSTTKADGVSITATDNSVMPAVTGSATLTQTAGPAAQVTNVQVSPSTIAANGVSTATATATVSDANGNPVTRDSVSFTDEVVGSTTDNGNGTYSATIRSTTTVGPVTIYATDSSVSPAVSGSTTLTQTAGPAASVKVTLNPPTILADGLSTITATAAITDAQGHPLTGESPRFSSSDRGQLISGVTNNLDGTYSVQIRGSTMVGSSTVTAADGSASGVATLIQAAGPSATTLVATPSSLVTNQGVTLVATVSSGTGAPSGTITFQNGGVTIPGCGGEAVSPSNPIATCQTAFAAAGSPARLTAVFTPGAGSTAPGSAGVLNLSIGPDSTSVLLQIPSSATTGRGITYSAQVSPPPNRLGPTEPTGTVQFLDNGQPVPTCASQPIVNGTAVCTVDYKRAGPHTITARYGGDPNFSSSSAPAAHLVVVALRALIIGSLSDTMQWQFHFTSLYTKVRQLIVNGASPGDTIRVTCHGQGCPFKKHTTTLVRHRRCTRKHGKRKCSTHGSRTALVVPLQGSSLSAGATVIVSITRPNWIGKYYVFTMRARRGPRIKISCLTPGYSKPGVGCST